MTGPDGARAVEVTCPDCDTRLPILVWAEPAGRADDGTLQVMVLTDKTEVEAHCLSCTGGVT